MQSLPARLPRYSRMVGKGKRALWVMAAVLAALLVALAWMNGGDNGARIVLSGHPENSPPAEAAVMVRPHYQGVDGHNQPFTLVADSATQPNSNTVILKNLSADMTTQDGKWLALTSGKGVYDTPRKLLHLTEHVSLFYADGFEFRTSAADVDLNAGTASGQNHVEGQGPAGILEAERFKVLDHGHVLQFNDKVYVKIYR